MPAQFLILKRLSFGLLGLGLTTLIFWLSLTHFKSRPQPQAPIPPLVHAGRRIIIPEQSPLRQFVLVEPVSEQLIVTPFTLPAIVEADPTTLVKVLPPLIGRITSLNKHLGDPVKAGEILFTMDSPDLAQALSDVEKAKSTLTLTEEILARQKKLSLANISARRDLQQAQNDQLQAQSEFARATARLKALKVENFDPSKQVLIVRSPMTGSVIELNAAVGGYWNDLTAPIMTVADLTQVYVTANAQEKDLRNIYVGQAVDIILDAYSEHWRSKVEFVSAILDPDTRTAGVNMTFENKAGLLKPNMFGKAIFLSQPHKGIILPLTTVIQRGFDSIVFIEVAPWQFEPRLLKLGAQIHDKVEVLSGLQANERVVVKGGIILND